MEIDELVSAIEELIDARIAAITGFSGGNISPKRVLDAQERLTVAIHDFRET